MRSLVAGCPGIKRASYPRSYEVIELTALFLGSEEASYINGAVLAVDGGRTAT